MAHVSDFDGFIFDYGGVLVAHQTEADHQRMAKVAGMPQEQFTENYWSKREDYDQGLVTNTEYWTAVAAAGGSVFNDGQIDELTEFDITSWMRYDERMWDWIGELRRAGKRVAMLSNMPLDLGLALRSRSDRLDRFHHVTLSCDVRSIKPEPAIYEECIAGIGTDRSRTLFFDDRAANVQGAEMLGIAAMEFTTFEAALLRLQT